jgi:hypothetical protein
MEATANAVPSATRLAGVDAPTLDAGAADAAALDVAKGVVVEAPGPPSESPAGIACAKAIRDGSSDYGRFFESRTPVASTRLLLRIFARACRAQFPSWAEAAERASHVGRAERSRILGRAALDACPGVASASVARELLASCPLREPTDPSLLLWRKLDAGTYAFVFALAGAGLRTTWLDELMLQASLTPELDR